MTGMEEKSETHGLRKKTPLTMWLPAAGLLLLALAPALLPAPALTASVFAAASLMANPSLAASLLREAPGFAVAAPDHLGAHAALLSLATLLMGVLVVRGLPSSGKDEGAPGS